MSADPAISTALRAPPPHMDFMVGWICVLQEEYRAAVSILDERYDAGLIRAQGDRNHYVLGRVGTHNVAINLPAAATYGQTHAYKIASDMKSTFPWIRCVLLVGIAGGVPCPKRDIRLGDVVLGTRVVPYATGKQTDQGFQRTGEIKKPSMDLLQAIALFNERLDSQNISLSECVDGIRTNAVSNRTTFHRPQRDRLYKAEFLHQETGCECIQAESPGRTNLCPRRERDGGLVRVFQGGIGSENQVMKNARVRDEIARREQVVCYEMEAAAVMDVAPCLTIRGISDYADGHKNDDWHSYAALSAAVCARELLLSVLPQTVAQYPLTLDGDHLARYITGAVSNPNAFFGSEIEKLRRNRDSLMERHNLLEEFMRRELRKMRDPSQHDPGHVREEVQRLKDLQTPLKNLLDDLNLLIEQRSGFVPNQNHELQEEYSRLKARLQKDTEAVKDLSKVAQNSLQSTGKLFERLGTQYNIRDLGIAGAVLALVGKLCGHAVALWQSRRIFLRPVFRKSRSVYRAGQQALYSSPHRDHGAELDTLLV